MEESKKEQAENKQIKEEILQKSPIFLCDSLRSQRSYF